MKFYHYLYPIIPIFIFSSFLSGKSLNTGLFFFSHESRIDSRTSLILNDNEPYPLGVNDVFSIEFDLYLRPENIKFGYIFRIFSDNNENFDLVINNEEVFLVIDNTDYPIDLKDMPLVNRYSKIRIFFDKRQKEVRLDMNGETLIHEYENLSNTNTLLVSFGECNLKGFITNDVPPMVLKDILIKYNGAPYHYWKLDKHTTNLNLTLDELKGKGAIIKNTYWLKDNNVYWKKRGSIETKKYPQIAFDSIHNEILTLTDTGCIAFALKDNSARYIAMREDIPLDPHVNHFFYDPIHQKMFSYDIHAGRINYFEESTGKWLPYLEESPDYAHHNRYISPRDSTLIIFGGYGHYKYRGDLIKIKLKTGEKETFDLSHTIIPRYLAAMGGNTSGDKIYIFGGKGAELGRQELGSKNFHELFEVDLKRNKAKKLYEISGDSIDKDYVFSNSLFVDEANGNLYALAYSNAEYSSHIILTKLGIKNKPIETFGDTLQFHFHDISSFCDLYYSPSLSQLVAVVASEDKQKENTAIVTVYTLDFPPLKEKEILQIIPKTQTSFLRNAVIISAIIILLIAIVFFLKTKKKKKKATNNPNETTENLIITEDEINWKQKEKYYIRNKSAIIFLGGFQVFDKNENNITGEFTPTLKLLLVLIILNTLKEGKGISSVKLQEFLWSDKTEESARNNRNVNIRKLRMLLNNVADINISNKNSYWTIDFPENTFSDYKEALHLLEQSASEQYSNPDSLERLLEVLSFGDILPNIQYDWIDNFKSDFSSHVIDVLMHYLDSKNEVIKNNASFRLKIADIILTYDSINEEAISVKSRILYKAGKKGLAKLVFSNFEKDYKTLLGEKYPKTLSEILEEEV